MRRKNNFSLSLRQERIHNLYEKKWKKKTILRSIENLIQLFELETTCVRIFLKHRFIVDSTAKPHMEYWSTFPLHPKVELDRLRKLIIFKDHTLQISQESSQYSQKSKKKYYIALLLFLFYWSKHKCVVYKKYMLCIL